MSRPFTVFNPATGEILRTGWTSSGRLQAQCKAGEAVLDVVAKDTEHYIDEGEVRERPILDLKAERGKVLDVPEGTRVKAANARLSETRGKVTVPSPAFGPVDIIPPFPYKRIRL